MKDSNKNPIPLTGDKGETGVTPQLRVNGGYWEVCYVAEPTESDWKQLLVNGQPVKAQGEKGDSMFQSVDASNADYVKLVLANGTEVKVPTLAAFEALKALVTQANSNIEALQASVTALESNDYVTGVTPVMDGANEIGYKLTFYKGGTVTIYHGNDGHTPEISYAEWTEDGNYKGKLCWTVDDEFLKDSNKNPIPLTGDKGDQGVTPQLKIEGGYWYVSYDNGATWGDPLYKATGENGQPGTNGDSFFQSVEQTEDEVILTLTGGTEIKLPKQCKQLDVTYIPEYNDGSASVQFLTLEAIGESFAEFNFKITPQSVAQKLAQDGYWNNPDILSVKAVYTKSRAVSLIDLPILKYTYDTATKISTIKVSAANLDTSFFEESKSASASLSINYNGISFNTDYIALVPSNDVESDPYVIYYTSTDGKVVSPKAGAFGSGVNIVKNEYKNGIGIITFDNPVQFIGDDAFASKNTLVSISFPEGIESIGNNAFNECTSLSMDLVIPETVTTIGSKAFRKTAITSLVLNDNLQTIGATAFSNLEKVEGKLEIPDNVTTIGAEAFYNCTGFTGDLTIPDNVTTIGDNAFYNCTGFEGVLTIGKKVTAIGNRAFASNKRNMSIINVEATTILNFSQIVCLADVMPTISIYTKKYSSYTFVYDGTFGSDLPNSLSLSNISSTLKALIGDKPDVYVPTGKKSMYSGNWTTRFEIVEF